MSYRPYFRTGIDELEALFKGATGVEALTKIRDELQFRTTQRALNLLRKVQEAIQAKEPKVPTVNQTIEAKKNDSIESPRTHQFHEHGPAQANRKPPSPIGEASIDQVNHGVGVGPQTSGASSLDSILTKEAHPAFESEPRTVISEKLPTENHGRLLDLLTYLEHLAKLGEKPVFALKDYQQLAFFEAELKGQIGITHDVSSDEGLIWLRIERLQRTDPPTPPQEIRDWIVLSRDPYQAPKIQNILTRTVTTSEADEVVSSPEGLDSDDRSPSLKLRDGKQMVDVILRLDAQPSTKSAITNYVSAKWTPWAEAEKPRRATIAIYDKFFSLYQSLQAEGVERPLEIVWGLGTARWKVRTPKR